MQSWSVLLLYITVVLANENLADFVSVKSPTWEIVGRKVKVFDSEVDEFRGIPYAAPPLGDKRFKKPDALTTFQGKFEALSTPNSCIQIPTVFSDSIPKDYFYHVKEEQSEDCLFLNIWRPSTEENLPDEPKAVMFWVHGGGFLVGSSGLFFFNGQFLATLGDVIVVTINYRLGAFGFLSVGTEEEPGNLGLYDQNMALKWVNENIRHFGGNPNRVTIFGESAGGVSVAALVTSPLSRGLFQRAIIMSGTSNIPRFITSKKEIVRLSNQIAERAGCAASESSFSENPGEVLGCLRRKDARDLANVEGLFYKEKTLTLLGPAFDEAFMDYESQMPFLPSIVNEVDVMIGTMKDEFGDGYKFYFPKALKPDTHEIDINLVLEEFKTLVSSKEGDFKIDDIFDPYLEGFPRENMTALDKAMAIIFADYLFTCPTFYYINHPGFKKRKVYFYYNTHPSSPGVIDTRDNSTSGAFHFEEVPYVFGVPLMREKYGYTESEAEFSKQLIGLWSSFAKSGHPESPRHYYWPQYQRLDPRVLELRADGARVLKYPPADRCWTRWKNYFDANGPSGYCYKGNENADEECDDD